ncbi:MAG: cell wall-binding repeat-containing protein [Solirubrobacterales bacterium]
MFRRIGYFLSDVGHWLRSHLPGRRFAIGLGIVILAAGLGAGGYLAYQKLSEDEPQRPAAAPQAVIQKVEASDPDAQDLGFPAFATRNTTRVAGGDPVANAAAVALATYPSIGGLEGPAAVALADVDDWPGAIAAASLAAEPVSAPLLFSENGEIPELTASALAALNPRGSADTSDDQVIQIGEAAEPDAARTVSLGGQSPAEVAAEVEKLRAKLTGGPPEHIVVVSADEPAFAMPAAGWAARSGDPVLFAQRDSVPQATLDAIERNEGVPLYVLGPDSAISKKAFDELEKAADTVTRISGPDPVANAVEFSRFTDGDFGWNINDPGHGFVLMNTERTADAGAAASLSASGTWGPQLLTDSASELPDALRGYLLDLKPGYQDDPTRALYNHIWIIGDQSAISVPMQAQVDELAELVEVRSGTGSDVLGPPPGASEREEEKPPGGGAGDKPKDNAK